MMDQKQPEDVLVMVRWKPEYLHLANRHNTPLYQRGYITIESISWNLYLSARNGLLNKEILFISEIQIIKIKNTTP